MYNKHGVHTIFAWTRMLLRVAAAVVLTATISLQADGQKRQQATPAQGDRSGQTIAVDQPYCDAYLPYDYTVVSGQQSVTPVFSNGTPTDDQIKKFLGRNETTSDPISKDGTFRDPGYPIFGDPKNKLYKDGSDLTRVIERLFAVHTNGVLPSAPATIPFCGPPNTSTASDAPDRKTQYFLVHIVRWKRQKGAYQTDSSDWYVFNRNDGVAAHRQFPFTFHPLVSGDLRIFGSSRVFFLAIHLAPTIFDPKTGKPSTTADNPTASDFDEFQQQVKVSYKLKVTKVEPANQQDLEALIGILTNKGGAAAAGVPQVSKDTYDALVAFLKTFGKRKYDGLYGAATLTNLQNLPVQITSTMNAELPTPNTSLPDLNAHSEKGIWDTSSGDSAATPAKGTPQSGCSATTNNQFCPENVVVQNEGLYWWDVSVGIPFKGISQVQYDSSGTGQITPRNVSKSNAYGFVVLAPWKEDIVSPPSLGIPHILVGLPLTGKVLNSPFIGFGETFNLSKLPSVGPKLSKVVPFGIRFYAGLVENKQFLPASGPGAAPPHHWVGHLQYGIEFSVKDIANKLTSGGKSTKASTSK
jgi:hypothetical protein